MMINSRSGSDSEVTPQAFRDLGLGRIVGNPTAAAVIATGSYRLINGGIDPHTGLAGRDLRPDEAEQLRHQPRELRCRARRVGREHAGGRAEGFDRELKGAIDEAMKMLKEGKWQFTTDQPGSQPGRIRTRDSRVGAARAAARERPLRAAPSRASGRPRQSMISCRRWLRASFSLSSTRQHPTWSARRSRPAASHAAAPRRSRDDARAVGDHLSVDHAGRHVHDHHRRLPGRARHRRRVVVRQPARRSPTTATTSGSSRARASASSSTTSCSASTATG